MNLPDNLDYLQIIKNKLPIECVRVSSAQAKGKARLYPYWGAVRYEMRLNKDKEPSLFPLERASSDRRSYRLAEEDAKKIAEKEERVFISERGLVTRKLAKHLIQSGIVKLSESDLLCIL